MKIVKFNAKILGIKIYFGFLFYLNCIIHLFN